MSGAEIYLGVLAVGLVGQWLLGPKSGAGNSTQPSEMPSVNQALRGTPLFISFGTVRVSAQITWTKNWTAVRQKGGGKGAAKGGGSGGGGSAKGGASGAYGYEYTWDLIYHFGMVDTPSVVTKAWVGSDVVKGATVAAWNTDFPDAVDLIFSGAGTADLQATETFYSPGYPTGSASLSAWPYFTSQEGLSPAWPSTCWLGFNQLQLGTTPAVPQLSVELKPAEAASQITVVAEVVNDEHGEDFGVGQYDAMVGYMKANGTMYSMDHGSFGGVTYRAIVRDVQGGATVAAVSEDQALADQLSYFPFEFSDDSHLCTIPVPGQPYFYILRQKAWKKTVSPSHTYPSYDAILYKIQSDGTVSTCGAARFKCNFDRNVTSLPGANMTAIGVSGDDGSIVAAYSGTSLNLKSYAVQLLPPDQLDGHDTYVSGDVEGDDRIHEFTIVGDNFLGGSTPRSSKLGTGLIPYEDGCHMFFYVDRGRIAYALSHTSNYSTWIEGQVLADPTLANGFLVRADFHTQGGVITFAGMTEPTIDNGLFTTDGLPSLPFSDVGLNHAGAAGDYNDDYFAFMPSGSGVMIGRTFSDRAWAAKVRCFDASFSEITSAQADWTDTPTDYIDLVVKDGMENMKWYNDDSSLYFLADFPGSSPERLHVKFAILNQSADLTPPQIIRKILTSEVYGFATASLFGFTITADSIDEVSYSDAVAKCESEGIKISVSYTNQDSLLAVINDLLAVYGGTLAEQNGKIFFDVFRAGDVVIRTIDNNHLLRTEDGAAPVTVTKGAIQDGYNSVQYQYLDRALDYKRNQVTLTDEVDIDINGPRNKVYPSQYVMTGSLAMLVAERALWSNMYGRDNYEFKLGWKDSDLRPGNQITLVDSFHPSLSKGVKVVISHKQETQRGEFSIKATRVLDNHLSAQHGYTNTASVSGGIDDILETAGPMDFRAYELPQEFQGANGYVYFGYNQSTYIAGAQLYISRDLGANYVLAQDVQPFVISGRMGGPLPLRTPGFVERGVEIWTLPVSGFLVNSPEFITDYTLDDATAALRQSGLTVMMVGSEALAMEGLTLLGQNHYRVEKLFRGWGGTPIAAVTSGAYWHEHAAGIFAFPITEDDIGNRLFYKIVGYNFAGRAYEVSSTPAKDYTVRGLRWLPRCATPIRTYVASALSWPGSGEFRGPYLSVVSGGSPVTLTWPLASNNEGFGAGGFGNGDFGHFVDDGTTTGWRVDIRSSNGTAVSSFLVSSPMFSYSVAQNSADFGGFASSVIYNVTPYNVKGDGPTTSSRSLSLIW